MMRRGSQPPHFFNPDCHAAPGRQTRKTMTSSDDMVVYRDVSKFFPVRVRPGQKERPELMVALDRVNATVRKGELVTLLGPSGCGKTTLLRLTSGLIEADEGAITIQSAPVAGPRKDACTVFQNFGLLPWRTVMGNVEFPLELDGVAQAERRSTAKHFLDLVGLGKFTEHYPHELSGGMQQRVGIARALMRKPILIFMDEPFGALDAQTREQLQEDFLQIWSRTGATVIFVTHSIDEALLLSDRVFVFTTGPGRIRSIVDSPLAAARLESDVRKHPEFGTYRAELRQMLRSDG
jgi:NitT/TauT family transport system ATP-binding protein